MQAKSALVRGFMKEYEEVPLKELNSDFKSVGDARRFYENYFEGELEQFKNMNRIWVNAFLDGRLVGFSTFEFGDRNVVYMKLLVVDPDARRQGVGERLTFAICDYFCGVRQILLLIRNVNERGRQFYKKIGFSDFEYERDDNFVDTSFLTGLKWTKGSLIWEKTGA